MATPTTEEGRSRAWSEIQALLQHTEQENVSMRQEIARLRDNLVNSAGQETDSQKAAILMATVAAGAPAVVENGNGEVKSLTKEEDDNDNIVLLEGGGDGLVGVQLERFFGGGGEGSSEGSVSCLQDRIQQMEESHYSVNEELQATVQELTDLQDSVRELQVDNDLVSREKTILIESLCRQTEKLNRSQAFSQHLKDLMLQHGIEVDLAAFNQSYTNTRGSEVERQISEQLAAQHGVNFDPRDPEKHSQEEVVNYLQEKLGEMETALEAVVAEKLELEKELQESKDRASQDRIELTRLKTQLEFEKSRVSELVQCRSGMERSELETMVEVMRRDKDQVERELSAVKEQYAQCHSDLEKYREEVVKMEEEIEETRGGYEEEREELAKQLRLQRAERKELEAQVAEMRDGLLACEEVAQRQKAEREADRALIRDLHKSVADVKRLRHEAEREVTEMQRRSSRDLDEWKQFQSDLQTAVVIANNIRTEAQEEVEHLRTENIEKTATIRKLQSELEAAASLRSKQGSSLSSPGVVGSRGVGSISSRVEGYLSRQSSQEDSGSSSRRRSSSSTSAAATAPPQSPLSVKNLIQTLENACHSDPLSPRESRTSPPAEPGPRRPAPLLAGSTTLLDRKLAEARNYNGGLGSHPASPTSPAFSPASYKVPDGAVPKDKPASKMLWSKADKPLSQALRNQPDRVGPSPPRAGATGSSSPAAATASDSRNPAGAAGAQSSRDTTDSSLASRRPNEDPLLALVKAGGGSKRNALLKWCQTKTAGYKGVEVTNFSSCWNDGLAFCALLHNYLPAEIPYQQLAENKDKRRNFSVAFRAARAAGVDSTLDVETMVNLDRPDWQSVMGYVTAIYKHFETN